jgi:hypothetical protein
MLVMCNARALGKFGVCSERASWDKTSWGACEHASRGDAARRCRLGSGGGSEERPEVSRKVQGDRTESTEHVYDRSQDYLEDLVRGYKNFSAPTDVRANPPCYHYAISIPVPACQLCAWHLTTCSSSFSFLWAVVSDNP